jgi:hypothetical protein
MPTLAQIRNRVDDWLAVLWPLLVAFQEAYFAVHGHYWQGLWTSKNLQENTTASYADAAPDNLDSFPSDQPRSWRTLPQVIRNLLESIPIPNRLRMDVYECGEGHGWSGMIQMKINGTIYERRKGVGPLADEYTFPWQKYEGGVV